LTGRESVFIHGLLMEASSKKTRAGHRDNRRASQSRPE
jgi:hypothetical protein